jgi:hypothetical protein
MKPLKPGVPGTCYVYRFLYLFPVKKAQKPRLTGLLWGLAVLVFLACRTSGTGVPEGAGFLPETGPAAGISARDAGTDPESPATGEGAAAGDPVVASLMEALYQSYGELSANIPGPAAVAVIIVASADPNEGEFAVEELTLLLVNSKKYRIVDRRSLDAIRAEQNFQLSGEVDDDTAVSIGHLIGAAMVITGSISPYDSAKYLRLKALDVETGQILAMSSRRFNSL